MFTIKKPAIVLAEITMTGKIKVRYPSNSAGRKQKVVEWLYLYPDFVLHNIPL